MTDNDSNSDTTAEEPDGEDETPSASDVAADVGYQLGAAVCGGALAVGRGAGKFGAGVLSKLPMRKNVYRKMITMGYTGLYKKTDAHVVLNTIYPDDAVVPRPAQVDSETGHLKSDNDEWWSTPNGLTKTFIGDVPVATAHVDHHQPVDHIGARAAESLDYNFEERQQNVVEVNGELQPVPNGQAVADGGAIPGAGGIEDTHLDVSNPEPGADGMVISMEKMYDLHFDRGSTEEMENQETRGRLAEMDPETDSRTALIYVLLFAAGILLGLFGPGLAQQFGGGAAAEATEVAATLGVFA
jgi:hypothetical protein